MRRFHPLAKGQGLLSGALKKSLFKICHLKDILTKRLDHFRAFQKRKSNCSSQNLPGLALNFAATLNMIFVISLIFFWLPFISKSPAIAQPTNRQPSSDSSSRQANISQPTKISLWQAISDAWEKNLPLNNLRLEAQSLAIEGQKALRQKLFYFKSCRQLSL